jgi:hypothetical protein
VLEMVSAGPSVWLAGETTVACEALGLGGRNQSRIAAAID